MLIQIREMAQKPSQWSTSIKQQLRDLQDNEDISVEVVEKNPNPNGLLAPSPSLKTRLDLFLDRKKHKERKEINLEKDTAASSHAVAKKEQAGRQPVINVEKQAIINLVDSNSGLRQKKLSQLKPSADVDRIQNSKAMQDQMRIIEQVNKPAWQVQKQKRQRINQEKYPRSHNYSNSHYFSSLNSSAELLRRDRCEKIEQNRKRREEEKKKQAALDKAKQERDRQLELQGFQSMLNNMIGIDPNFGKPKQQVRLENRDILEHLEKQEEDLANKGKSKPVQQRYGLQDVVRQQGDTPQLIHVVLKHKFGREQTKPETKRIPNQFQDNLIYKKVFHYLLTNQCIADVRQRLDTVEKKAPTALRIQIGRVQRNTDSQVNLFLTQLQNGEQGDNYLKNLSLSKFRLGLVSSSKEFRRDNYGIPGRNPKEFGFLVLLYTPESKEDLNKEVRAMAAISEPQLQLMLKRRRTREVSFFDLQKLSTHVRQYQAVSNMDYSQLSPAILNPSLLEKERGVFAPCRQLLDSILGHLQQTFNQTQWRSIREMVFRQSGFVLLQGPPGTGKTSTLMGLVSAQYQYLRKSGSNRKIMICAPANAAVDHIVRRIKSEGLINGEGQAVQPNILRVGIVQTECPLVRSVSLDHICEKELLQQSEAARKFSKLTTAEISDKMIGLQKEVRKLSRDSTKSDELLEKKAEMQKLQTMLFHFRTAKTVVARRSYSQIEGKHIREAEIILSTLSSSGNERLTSKIKGEIACVIVDEAAQATEPNLLISLQTGVEKVLLIGDPRQLPSTCLSPDANNTFFNRSLFERLIDAGTQPYFLNIQYRMAPLIRHFPSHHFYDNRLIDAQQVLQRKGLRFLSNFQGRSVVFIDIKDGREERMGDSYWNQREAQVAGVLIQSLLDRSTTLGLITPYQAQRRRVIRCCERAIRGSAEDISKFESQVMINTVDSFQGQEKDVIIVSTVRSNSRGQVGFLNDERRINVALSRAKHFLIVIGNGYTLGGNQIWDSFLTYVQGLHCYYQVSNPQEQTDRLHEMFQGQNKRSIHRQKHSHLSKDIRRIERNRIEYKDFKSYRDQKQEKYPGMAESNQEAERQKEKKEEELRERESAMAEEARRKAEEKVERGKQREREEMELEDMSRRMRAREEDLRNNSDYNYLFE